MQYAGHAASRQKSSPCNNPPKHAGFALHFTYYWVASMANPVEICVSFVGLFIYFFVFIFSLSVKVLPVTPLLSAVFVHRAFCAYFLRIERVVGNSVKINSWESITPAYMFILSCPFLLMTLDSSKIMFTRLRSKPGTAKRWQ